MPRWEPNAKDRLADAALTLFAERGYDATTVDDVAAAAGLTRSTFFRHVKDKREILFAGQEGLAADLRALVDAAPASDPLGVVGHALAGLGRDWFTEERRPTARRRALVVAASPELAEREAGKSASLEAALGAGLRERGVGELDAAVAAALGRLVLTRAVAAWAPGTMPFADAVERALADVRRGAGRLTG